MGIIVLFYLTVLEAAIIDTDNLRNGELRSSTKLIQEQIENDESFHEDDIAKDDIAKDDIVKDDITKKDIANSDIALSKLGIAILRCCSSVTDTHNERCFEINGFGGIRFAEKPCAYLPTVTSLLQSL